MAAPDVNPDQFLNNGHYQTGFIGLYSQLKEQINCDLWLKFDDGDAPIKIHKCLADIYFTKV